jgi:PKD repeat protein
VNSTLQNPKFNFPNPWNYQITLVASNQTGNHTITKNITVLTSPIIAIQSLDSICKGISTTLIATGANNYIWNNNVYTTNNTVSPQVNNVYKVPGLLKT